MAKEPVQLDYSNAQPRNADTGQRRADFCWLIFGTCFGTLLDIWIGWMASSLTRIGRMDAATAFRGFIVLGMLCSFGVAHGIAVLMRGARADRVLAIVCTGINMLPLVAWASLVIVGLFL